MLLAVRSSVEPRGLADVGLIAVRDLALTLLLWALFGLVATAVGYRILGIVRPKDLTELEQVVFGYAIGSGAISFMVFSAAILQALNTLWISTILLVAIWWTSPTLNHLFKKALQVPSMIVAVLKDTSGLGKITAVLVTTIGVAAFAGAIGPPWDYDGLMYHLLGPQIFLDAEGLFPYPANWYVNGPFNIEMLFTVGMAFGDDVFAKLVHLLFGACYLASSFLLASRVLPPNAARIVPLILLGVPTIPIWASFAYIDLGWSTFELISLAGLVIWWTNRDLRWLFISGVTVGLASGSKYLGLVGLAVGGFALLVLLMADRTRPKVASLFWFGAPALLIAGPWYLKNLVWFGNPVFPMLWGGGDWTPERLQLYSDYLGSFGTGRDVADYLLLPVNVYVRHAEYGTVMNSIDIPSLLFPLAILTPFLKHNRGVTALLALAGIRIVAWSIGSQQLRFLLPIYPILAIGAAQVVSVLQVKSRTVVMRRFWPALVVGLVFVTAYYQVVVLFKYRPVPAALGAESRKSFQLRINKDYPSIAYFLENVDGSSKLLMLGDARGYLCIPRCLPDPDHFRWAAALAALEDQSELATWFTEQDISHVLFSVEDLDFLLQHDPQGVLRDAIIKLIEWRDAGCLDAEFSDGWSTLYAVTCSTGDYELRGQFGVTPKP